MRLAVIFDFDNTIEEWLPFEDEVEEHIAKELSEKYDIDPAVFKRIFDHIKVTYLHSHSLPQDYGRDIWFSESLAYFGIDNVDLKPIIKHYWELITERVQAFPGTIDVLQQLRDEHYLIGMLSDSDGDRMWKDMRIKKLGVEEYFDEIVTSDEIGANKPHPRCFLEICNRLKVNPSHAIMIGDNPPKDLPMAKQLGMTTVWQRQGVPQAQKANSYPYIDFVVDDIREVPGVVSEAFAKIRH